MKMRNLISYLFSSLLLLGLTSNVSGQERFIESYGYGLWFGIRDVQPEIFSDGAHLDFLNYLESNNEYPEYELLGMNFYFKFRNNWELDTKFAVCSDLELSNYNLKVRYALNKFLGISAGYYRFPQYMSEFDAWYLNKNENFFENIPGNYAQIRVFENGLTTGLYLNQNIGFIHLRLDINGGVSSLSKFDIVFERKKMQSNFKQKIVYNVGYSPTLFFFPELTANFDVIKLKYNTMGIQLKTNWMYLKRSMNYTQTSYSWTYEDKAIEEVINPNHSFKKFEFDVGIFLRW